MKSALGAADLKLSTDDASPWSLSTFAIEGPLEEREINKTLLPAAPSRAASLVPVLVLAT